MIWRPDEALGALATSLFVWGVAGVLYKLACWAMNLWERWSSRH
jgi:hypothetical protein